jgi:programmed cell death protein 5
MAAHQDNELAAIRAQRLQAMQDQIAQQAQNQMEAEEQAQQAATHNANIDAMMRKFLSSEARSRLARIALVEPARAQSLKEQIAALCQAGEMNVPVSDASVKSMLAQQSKSRSNASIRRI